MAFKLTKAEVKEGAQIAAALEEALAILDKACEVFNNDLESMRLVVQDAIDGYNDKLSDARQFSEDLATRFEIEIDEKSEKWQEGEAGSAASELKDAWEALELDDIEADLPDDIKIDLEHASDLRDMMQRD